MISKLQINNYKSLFDLTLEVGRFNVFIGENGCGKSNLLEAIALASAAAADKLDHEFLGSRGIRVTEPQLMRSAFSNESVQEPINIGVSFKDLNEEEKYTLNHDNQAYAKWTRLDADLSKKRNTLLKYFNNTRKEIETIIEKVKNKVNDEDRIKKINAELEAIHLQMEEKLIQDYIKKLISNGATNSLLVDKSHLLVFKSFNAVGSKC